MKKSKSYDDNYAMSDDDKDLDPVPEEDEEESLDELEEDEFDEDDDEDDEDLE